MDALNLFFQRFSYKFPKGYPDMNDPQDKKLLYETIDNLIGEHIDTDPTYNIEETNINLGETDIEENNKLHT